MNVIVNGLLVNYQKAGKGPLVLCIPGWGDTLATYKELTSELVKHHTVLVPDLPGFGGSQTPDVAWSLGNYIDFINDWLKKIGVKDIYALVGHSYGGSLAIKAVGEGQLKPKRLVLISSAGIRNNRGLRKTSLKAFAKVAKVPLKLLPGSASRKIKGRLYKSLGSDIMLLPHMEATFRKIIGEDVLDEASKIKTPTLLIYGYQDTATPPRFGQLFQTAIPNSKLELLRGGHHIHQDEPVQVSEMIEDFLR